MEYIGEYIGEEYKEWGSVIPFLYHYLREVEKLLSY